MNFSLKYTFFLKASSKLSSASVMLTLKLNFLKIYLTKPCDFMVEVLFRKSLFFWYMKVLLRSFRFWDIENVKHKFQPRYAYKLYAHKKRVYEMWIKVTDYCKNKFLRHFYQIYFQICPQFARIISAKTCFSLQK